jgi:restriction system protein
MTRININATDLSVLVIGRLEAKYSADGSRILRYYIDFRHKGLNIHKSLSAPEIYILQNKVDALIAAWEKKYSEHQRRTAAYEGFAAGKGLADQISADANVRLTNLSNTLSHTLGIDDRINFESLKDKKPFYKSRFVTSRPTQPKLPGRPEYHAPEIRLRDKLFGRASDIQMRAEQAFRERTIAWEESCRQKQLAFEQASQQWEAEKIKFETSQAAEEQRYKATQERKNAEIDQFVQSLRSGDASTIMEYATLVLEKSDYKELFEKSFDLDYQSDTKTLLIDYELPSPDNMPIIKSARYIKATGDVKETYLPEKTQRSNYDSLCYQICLRTIHEIFESDGYGNIEKVLFNGTATYVNKSTGQDIAACIMSILVARDEFEAIDLSRVDPKSCFKTLKGVSASSLSALAPIPPIIKMNRDDKRFVEAKNTIDGIDDATNLASMDWEDFEHLVRGLFEKEFASRGGDVHITRASSDGGIDAVAFDPDPITGGKIVIQAKRYTRTVGVSAVRDLYGAMQHENASRGILVTTADYGPDAYKFASGKPMTLLTGANLLHLLSKHGYHAKIDILEARREIERHSSQVSGGPSSRA